MKRWITGALALLGCVTMLAAPELETFCDSSGKPVRYAGRVAPGEVRIPQLYQPRAREMRGVWVATVENIDFAPHSDAATFRSDFAALASTLAKRRFNAVFVQVRPNNDAFYPSAINPWSRWLTGTEGKGIAGFDPLAYMLSEAKRNSLEFHAWLNPYRVIGKTKLSKAGYLATLDPKNFARRNPSLVLEVPLAKGERLLFLDPGNPAVVKHVVDTVREIVAKYDVDAIHFDDYFYPYSQFGDIDNNSFARFNPGKLSRADWRRRNVDTLVFEVSRLLKSHEQKTGRKVKFGISPFGIWANQKDIAAGSLTAGKSSYLAQYADTRGWVKKGYLDYIVPQLYWPFNHEVAAYAALVDWWSQQVKGTGTDLYIGIAAYQAGSSSSWSNPDELYNQLRYDRKFPEVKGEVFFSCRSILEPRNPVMRSALSRIYQRCWNRPAMAP